MTARQVALVTLVELEKRKAYSNLLLDKALSSANLSPSDSGFVTALVMGVTERRLTLDYFIGVYCGKQVSAFAPQLIAILRMGLHQLLYMQTPSHAAVNESVELAKQYVPRAASLTNAVLRKFIREGGKKLLEQLKGAKYEVLAIRYSINPELIKLFFESYGEQTAELILKGFELGHGKATIAVNTQKITSQQLIIELEATNIKAVPSLFQDMLEVEPLSAALKSKAFEYGLFFVQGLSSRLVAEFAEPKGKVLDLCAAPGGKSFSMALLAPSGTSIMALELHANRVSLMIKEAERMELEQIQMCQNDATIYNAELGQADVVLCDLPCSGFGVLHKKPELRYRTLNEILDLPQRQMDILTTASRYLVPGGRLIYSTCTLNPAENEQLVDTFLASHPDFSACKLPYMGRENFIYANETSRLTILPDGEFDGFFIAALQKNMFE